MPVGDVYRRLKQSGPNLPETADMDLAKANLHLANESLRKGDKEGYRRQVAEIGNNLKRKGYDAGLILNEVSHGSFKNTPSPAVKKKVSD